MLWRRSGLRHIAHKHMELSVVSLMQACLPPRALQYRLIPISGFHQTDEKALERAINGFSRKLNIAC